ncbi:MAG TPA: TetR/AcrR family transcriptional regulator [Novosphingobium sp.]|nr:TetR/AcrR family transcriptional regulator [Novosphingobium sp.]
MPIIVDKQERRALVLSVAFDLVADRGIDALTFREIAAATGCSTSIVSHYFRNKNELLFGVYRQANDRARERLEAAFEAGLPLLDCFGEIMPTSEDGRRNWRVWIAFWGRAHLEPAYLEERRRAAEQSLELYRVMLVRRSGEARGGEARGDLLFEARRLIASVAGISLEACFAPDDWTVERMREVLAAELIDLGFATGL